MTPKTTKKVFQCVQKLFDPSQDSTCELYKTCKSPYMARSGDEDAEILIIGEAPGAEEDEHGKAFIGDAGKLLRHGLSLAGVTKFALTNACRCRPPGNRDPKMTEIRSCKEFLLEDIVQLPNLKLIVLAGNYAMLTILGYKGILEASGTYQTINIKTRKFGILCVMHPSYILQNQNELNKFLNHIGRIPNALNGNIVDHTDKGTYHVITTKSEWDELLLKIKEVKEFAYDLETNRLDPYYTDSTITCISFSLKPREAYVIPILDNIPLDYLKWSGLEDIMEDPTIKKIGQNIKFDNLWLRVKADIEVKGTVWDTSISQFLLDENESHGLKSMAWKYTKLGGYENMVQGEPHNHPPEDQALQEYAAIDADITNRIYYIHKPLIYKDPGLVTVQNTLLLPVSDVLMDMERRGIGIDSIQLVECKKAVDLYLAKLHKDIFKRPAVKTFNVNHPKSSFNPRSAIHLREVLFTIEGLTPIKYTPKTKAFSTDRSVLDFYKDKNKLCELLADHSMYASMKSKMIKELEEHTVDGRIHTHYWVTETGTGRTSSNNPNLQNVTKGKKDVVGIRKVFIADDGFDLLEADYNQHELRCMAELAEDLALYQACQSGDVHASTTSSLLGKDPSKITEDERRDVGKTFNFGLIYGLTRWGVMRRLNCSEKYAKDLINRFFSVYSNTKLYMDATTWFVQNYGYVKSRTGRYRRFPIWKELEDTAIREAINMPVQSLAGDILLYSLIGIQDYLKKQKARSYLCLEIHDSLILNLHRQEHDLMPEIKNIMLTYFKQFIPFKYDLAVDMKIGSNWGMMEKIDV